MEKPTINDSTDLEPLDTWYSSLRVRSVDLVGGYAGVEFFIVEGDSLLRWAFSDTRIDFDEGFQLLHAVFVVEGFLERLRGRRCNFAVVFFDAFETRCVPSTTMGVKNPWKYRFARSAIVEHLVRVGSENGSVSRFQSIEDIGFQQYLQDRRPYFVMCHGGADVDISGKGDAIPAPELRLAPLKRLKKWMDLGLNLVLINECVFMDSKIFATVLQERYAIEPTFLVGATSVEDSPEVEQKEKLVFPGFSSARERLSIAAISRALKQEHPEEQQKYLHSVFLLHTALISHLSLIQRSFPLPGKAKSGPELHNFLQRLTAISQELLQTNEVSFEDAKHDLYDFIDGRLLLKLMLLTPDPVSDAVKETFSKLSSEVHRLTGVALDFPELTGTETVIPDVSPDVESVEDAVSVDGSATEGSTTEVGSTTFSNSSTATLTPRHTTILRFTNPVFDPYLSDIKLPPEVSMQDVEEGETDAEQVPRETQTWQFTKKVVTAAPTKASKKPSLGVGRLGKTVAPTGKGQQGDKLERRAVGKARKSDQNYSNQMNRYAASLTDSTDGSINPKLIVVEEKGKKKEVKGAENTASEKLEPGKIVKGGKRVTPDKKEAAPAKGKASTKETTAPKGKATGKLSAAEIIRQNNSSKKAGKEAKLQDLWNNFARDIKKMTDDEEAMGRLDTWLKETQKTMSAGVAENLEWPFVKAEARLCKLQLLQRIWTGLCCRGEQHLGYTVAAVLFDEARRILSSAGLTQKVQSIIQNIFDSLGIAMPLGKPLKTLPDRKLGSVFDASWNGKIESFDTKLGMSSEEFQLLHCGPWMDRNMDSAPDPRVPFEPDGWQIKVLDELDGDKSSALVVAPTSSGKTFIAFYAMEKILKESDDGILVYVAPTKALVNQIAAEVISRFKKNYRYAGKFVWAIATREYTMNKPKECQILITVPHVLQSMLMSPTNALTWTPRIKRIIFDEVHSIGNSEDGAIWEQLLLLSPCPIVALSATVGNAEEFSAWLKATQSVQHVSLNMIQHPHRYSDLRKFVYVPKKNKTTTFDGLSRMSRFRTLGFGDGMLGVHPVAALVNAKVEMQDDLALEPRDCLQLYWALLKAQTEQFPVSGELDYKKVFGTKGGVIKKKDVIEWEAALKEVVKSWMKDTASPFAKVVQILTSEKAGEETSSNVEAEGEETGVVPKAEADVGIDKDAYLHENTLQLLQSLHNSNALPAILFNYDRESCEKICEILCEQLDVAETKWRETNPKWTSTVKAWEAYMANKSARGSKVQKVAKPEAGQSKNDMIRDAGELEGSYLDRFDPKYPSAEFSFADTRKQGNAELENDINDLIRWGTSPMLVNAFKRGIGVHHSGLNRKYRQAVEMLFRKGYLRVVIATGTLSLGVNMPTRTTVFAGDSTSLTALNYRQASGRAGRRGFDNIGNVVFHGFSLDRVDRIISSKLPPLLGHFPITASLVLRMFILLSVSKGSRHAERTIDSLLSQRQLVLGGEAPKEQVLHHLRFSIEFLRKQKLIDATGTPLNFAGLTSHLYYTEDAAFALHALLYSGYLQEVCRDIYEKPESTCLELLLVMAHLFGRMKARPGIKTLPPMPARAVQILKKQNDDTLKTYTTYVETFAKEYCKTPEDSLPFSKLSCGNIDEKTSANPTARSAFVALSGHTDTFTSIEDLTTSVRAGILPEGASIPHIPIDNEEKLNGYLYDFYKHADVVRLDVENGIRPNTVWFVLKDFSVVLSAVVPGLVSFLKDGPGAYYDLSTEKGEEKGELQEIEPVNEEMEGEEEEMIKKSEGFGKVLKAFKVLRTTFDEKFRVMWA